MEKLMKAMHKNEKGFTLVELMVVVVIIGILVAIAIPIFMGITANANRNTTLANLRTIGGAISMFNAEHGYNPECITWLTDEADDSDDDYYDDYVYLDAIPEGPSPLTQAHYVVSDGTTQNKPGEDTDAYSEGKALVWLGDEDPESGDLPGWADYRGLEEGEADNFAGWYDLSTLLEKWEEDTPS